MDSLHKIIDLQVTLQVVWLERELISEDRLVYQTRLNKRAITLGVKFQKHVRNNDYLKAEKTRKMILSMRKIIQ